MIAYLDNAGTIMFAKKIPNITPATMACAFLLEKGNVRNTMIAKIRNFVSTEDATTFAMFMKIVDPFLVFVSIIIAINLRLVLRDTIVVRGDSNALKGYAQK